MKETLVMFPAAGMGHLIPMVELAKLFVQNNFSVTILLLEFPFETISKNTTPFISHITSTYPSISFHHLPTTTSTTTTTNPLHVIQHFLRNSNPHILSFLNSLSQTTIIHALILDFFCTAALDVANELHLPSYFLFSTSASNLATFLLLPSIQSQTTSSFRELGDTPIILPGGLPPIPASHIPNGIEDRDDVGESLILNFQRLLLADGIIINTFESLERKAVKALRDGLCAPPGTTMPPVYCVGPVTSTESGGEGEKHECLTWLDKQPKRSVVFLCFGSMGSFSKVQLHEIATGLERSGQRFLWVVRSPPPEGDLEKKLGPRPEPDLDVLMPEGFLERTKGRGMVVKSWAPQAAVLDHESVGAFVSHCGWNSVLETVSVGVPIVAWPLYAEQRMNKVSLVEEMKLAVEMSGYDKEMVTAEEVEGKIRWVMESEGGEELRELATAVKDSAVAAVKKGGSSHEAFMELVKVVQSRKGFDGRILVSKGDLNV